MRPSKSLSLRLATLALAAWVALMDAASAQDAAREYRVAEQSLGQALREFALASNLDLLFSPDLVAGKKSQTLAGKFTVDEGLRTLLRGSGLEYSVSGSRAVISEMKSSPTSATSGENGYTRWELARARTSESAAAAEPARTPEDLSAQRIALEELVVTGTYLRDITPTSPVLTFDRTEIERGGYTSVQDVLRQIPQNFGSTTSASAGANIGRSSAIDLRGFGSKATLTLVNGRRVSGAGGDRGRGVDISMIPLAAIERIEVLTDGASALYGSDAIGGVTNLILRKDFTGSETSLQYGDSSTDSDYRVVAQVLGTSWNSGRILAAAQYRSSDALTLRALDIDTFDFRSRGGSDQRTRGVGNATSNGTVTPLGVATFTTAGLPAGTTSVTLPTGDGRALSLAQLGINQVSFGDFAIGDVVPEEEDASGYVLVEQEVGPVTLFIDGVYGHRTSFLDQGPVFSVFPVPAGCAASGATANCNPFSPFAEPVIVTNLLDEFGSVVSDIERDGWFVNGGARGHFGSRDWTWEVGATSSEDRSEVFQPFAGSPQPIELQARLANADPLQAFNSFDDGTGQSAGVVDALQLPLRTNVSTTLRSGLALTQGPLWQMAGGPVRLALGVDYREEELQSNQVQTGGVPLPGLTASIGEGSRDLSAVFGELYFPLVGAANARSGLHELAFSVAGRFEDYSDFGQTSNPKLGLLWRPLQDLALRANWGTSFRAPSLIELFATVIERQTVLIDPNRPPGSPAQVLITRREGGNRDLQEETAETYSIAAEYRPRWLDGVRLSFNYFHTRYDDRIRGSLDGLNTATLFQFEPILPPGIIVRDANGVLQSIFITNINIAETVASGHDVMAGYGWKTERFGSFDLSAAATFYTKFEDHLSEVSPPIDFVGKVGNVPDRRGRLSLSWSSGPWGTTMAANHVDGFWNAGTAPTPLVLRTVDSQTTVDLQLSFVSSATTGWPQGFTVRLGATNLLDERPPFVDGANRGLDLRNATLEGRTVYLRLNKSFL